MIKIHRWGELNIHHDYNRRMREYISTENLGVRYHNKCMGAITYGVNNDHETNKAKRCSFVPVRLHLDML